MVVNKRKKNSRQRGTHTHGWGSKKKHRGAGNRGGRGLAGTGKRSDQMKSLYWKEKYFGKKGFKKKGVKKCVNTINICYLEENIEKLLSKKIISKENGYYSVDLGKMGYNKLLSKGRVNNKLRITIEKASKKAVEKVKAKGGEVILTAKPAEKIKDKGQ